MLVVMVLELICPSGFAQNTSSPNAPSFSAEGGRFASFDFPSPGVTDTEATAITPSGAIVGRYFTPDGHEHGFVLNEGKFTAVDVPAAPLTDAAWINARGDIVGSYGAPGGHGHAYVLSRGTFNTIDFPSANPVNTTGFGISNTGDVVGVEFVGSDFFHGHGYLFRHGEFTLIDSSYRSSRK